MALLPGFVTLPGKSKRVRNVKTGEEMSRRQYLQRYVTGGETLEKRARESKEKNPEAFYSKTARGRKSVRGLDEESKKVELSKRAEKDLEARLEKELARKPHIKKFSTRHLKPGTSAYRTPFYTRDDLMVLLSDARKSGKVFSYGLGISGIDDRDLRRYDVFVLPLTDINYSIPKDKFTKRVNDVLAEKTYFLPRNFWVHFHFRSDYVKKRAQQKKKP